MQVYDKNYSIYYVTIESVISHLSPPWSCAGGGFESVIINNKTRNIYSEQLASH